MNTDTTNPGNWLVHRRVRLVDSCDAALRDRIIAAVTALDGVAVASVAARTIHVRYDLTRSDYDAICQCLRALPGVTLKRDRGGLPDWVARWRQLSDETGRDNAARPPAPCCNRSPNPRKRS